MLGGRLGDCAPAVLEGGGREAARMSFSAGLPLALSASVCWVGFEHILKWEEETHLQNWTQTVSIIRQDVYSRMF